ncbi:MAG TPA: ATP-binding cassette domain-containing protein, partial [Patescibacteria group bacterium]|nr:ATP-binding cassette domain-containing protein [Patescibacteria group bacterium]
MTEEIILETKNLTKTFNPWTRAQVVAVEGVNLKLRKGEILMIMGPSGSGKTTLLTMLGGLLKPTSGNISLSGQRIDLLSGKKLTELRRRNMGFIFQSFNLLQNLSAIENAIIAGAFNGGAKSRAEDLLVKLGLRDRLRSKPNELSGGE